jgi:hypothetical protein
VREVSAYRAKTILGKEFYRLLDSSREFPVVGNNGLSNLWIESAWMIGDYILPGRIPAPVRTLLLAPQNARNTQVCQPELLPALNKVPEEWPSGNVESFAGGVKVLRGSGIPANAKTAFPETSPEPAKHRGTPLTNLDLAWNFHRQLGQFFVKSEKTLMEEFDEREIEQLKKDRFDSRWLNLPYPLMQWCSE